MEVGGALAVTQQLSAISTGSSMFQDSSPSANPFGTVRTSSDSLHGDVMCTNGSDADQFCMARLVNGMATQTMDVPPGMFPHPDGESGESLSSLQDVSRTSTMFGPGSGIV